MKNYSLQKVYFAFEKNICSGKKKKHNLVVFHLLKFKHKFKQSHSLHKIVHAVTTNVFLPCPFFSSFSPFFFLILVMSPLPHFCHKFMTRKMITRIILFFHWRMPMLFSDIHLFQFSFWFSIAPMQLSHVKKPFQIFMFNEFHIKYWQYNPKQSKYVMSRLLSLGN